MKKISPPPVKVPRLNSLLHRLQKNPGPDDEPYLDQLMIFLDDPPDGVANRWKAGAEMCAAWGIATTDTSVWRLYTSYRIEWRVRVALKIDDAEIKPEELAEKATQLMGLRTCEMLGNPTTPPAALVSLMRLDLRQKFLVLARERLRFQELGDTQRALKGLRLRAARDRYAQFALNELEFALSGMPSKYRDKLNEPFWRAMGIDPNSLYSADWVNSEQQKTPKTP